MHCSPSAPRQQLLSPPQLHGWLTASKALDFGAGPCDHKTRAQSLLSWTSATRAQSQSTHILHPTTRRTHRLHLVNRHACKLHPQATMPTGRTPQTTEPAGCVLLAVSPPQKKSTIRTGTGDPKIALYIKGLPADSSRNRQGCC